MGIERRRGKGKDGRIERCKKKRIERAEERIKEG